MKDDDVDREIEQEEWIERHGSPRLRKAVELGMLHLCQGVYRDERVNAIYPRWFCGQGRKYRDLINPTLEELLYLEGARNMGREFMGSELRQIFRFDRWIPVVETHACLPEVGLSEWISIFRYCSPHDEFRDSGYMEMPPALPAPDAPEGRRK